MVQGKHCTDVVGVTLTPLVDDLLDGVVPLLVGVGAHALEWVRPIHIRAPIAHVHQGPMCGIHPDSSSDGTQICVRHCVGQCPVQHLLRGLRSSESIVSRMHRGCMQPRINLAALRQTALEMKLCTKDAVQ